MEGQVMTESDFDSLESVNSDLTDAIADLQNELGATRRALNMALADIEVLTAKAKETEAASSAFRVGDSVGERGGDYRFDGHVRAIVIKASGEILYVVEDDRGVLFIWREDQMTARDPSAGPSSESGSRSRHDPR